MRMFYVFEIKKEIKELYQDNPSSLYKILSSIYYMHKEEANYGFNLFNQITNRIKVQELSNKIYIDMHTNIVYTKNSNEHVINDLYKNEISILKVRKSHILIQSNKSYNKYFDLLASYNNNYFICDFLENDFFFISDIKNLIKM